MKLIAAVDTNWAIGNKNALLVRIPADQKFFRNETTGKTIIMGRKTLESFPGGVPLPNRKNIVLSHDTSYTVKGASVVHSLDELRELIKDENTDDVYCIGGGSVYKALLDDCDTALITMIDKEFEADTHIPSLEKDDEWELTEESEEQTYFDLVYYFRTYKRKGL
ncbi:MAG: dihydrofolate reductase [Lachnospiraceae bacterium]|nr:dihydrofolate reductase [Lachnospiraceae bacterium]